MEPPLRSRNENAASDVLGGPPFLGGRPVSLGGTGAASGAVTHLSVGGVVIALEGHGTLCFC